MAENIKLITKQNKEKGLFKCKRNGCQQFHEVGKECPNGCKICPLCGKWVIKECQTCIDNHCSKCKKRYTEYKQKATKKEIDYNECIECDARKCADPKCHELKYNNFAFCMEHILENCSGRKCSKLSEGCLRIKNIMSEYCGHCSKYNPEGICKNLDYLKEGEYKPCKKYKNPSNLACYTCIDHVCQSNYHDPENRFVHINEKKIICGKISKHCNSCIQKYKIDISKTICFSKHHNSLYRYVNMIEKIKSDGSISRFCDNCRKIEQKLNQNTKSNEENAPFT